MNPPNFYSQQLGVFESFFFFFWKTFRFLMLLSVSNQAKSFLFFIVHLGGKKLGFFPLRALPKEINFFVFFFPDFPVFINPQNFNEKISRRLQPNTIKKFRINNTEEIWPLSVVSLFWNLLNKAPSLGKA